MDKERLGFRIGLAIGIITIIAVILTWIYVSHFVAVSILYIESAILDGLTTRYALYLGLQEQNLLVVYLQKKKIIKSTRGILISLIITKILFYLAMFGLTFIDCSASVTILAFISGIQYMAATHNIILVKETAERYVKQMADYILKLIQEEATKQIENQGD